MTDEIENPPAPPADPPVADKPVTRAELEELRGRVDDVEDVAYSTAAMVLDDDEEAGPEKTTVGERTETPPASETPNEPPPAAPVQRHSGLFS